MANWADLPTDLMHPMAEQLYSSKEFVCVGAVCKSWLLGTSMLENNNIFSPKLPCLMLAEEELDEENGVSKDATAVPARGFFDLSNGKTRMLKLPEISRRIILGVNYGWLFTLGNDLQINLFHPFSRDQISLPHFLSFSNQYNYNDTLTPQRVIDFFIRKVALSSHPKQEECVVMAIYGEFAILAFARPGDEVWTNVPVPWMCFMDVVYYRRRFYAVDTQGSVVVCDIDGSEAPKSTVLAPPLVGTCGTDQKYLVESSGDLLLVIQYREGFLYNKGNEDIRYYTVSFTIMKMVECSEKEDEYPYCWVPVESLGDRALFIGRSTSISLSATEYNGRFKANCIYFTDGFVEQYGKELEALGGGDMGIFDMENGTIERHYKGVSLSYISPPLWII